ncbi:MAG: peptide ABC transporter permease [bacterium]|nr:MAG: peptide ABC transporter permease [bacterium]
MAFILNRLIQMIIVLFILSFVVFMLIDLMPGDATTRLKMENPGIKKDDLDRLKKLRGLDQSVTIQYFFWLKRVIRGDLGYSITYKIPVKEMIADKLITTLKLAIPVLILTLAIAIPIGIIAGIRQYSAFDYSVNLLAFIGFSVPTFVLGLLAILFFAQHLNLFPPIGLGTPENDDWLDQVQYLVLPVLTLSFYDTGNWVRYIRGTLLEVIKPDYIRTAMAKGLPDDVVIVKHAVRNILIPFITIFALSIPVLFSGALITEKVFGVQGMGHLLYDSATSSDTDVAMAAFLFIAMLTLFFNFLADILYTVVDPRVRIKGRK